MMDTLDGHAVVQLDGASPHRHASTEQFLSILEGALELCQQFDAPEIMRVTGRQTIFGAIEECAKLNKRRIVSMRLFDRYEAGLAALNALNLIFQGYEVFDFGGKTEGYIIVGMRLLEQIVTQTQT